MCNWLCVFSSLGDADTYSAALKSVAHTRKNIAFFKLDFHCVLVVFTSLKGSTPMNQGSSIDDGEVKDQRRPSPRKTLQNKERALELKRDAHRAYLIRRNRRILVSKIVIGSMGAFLLYRQFTTAAGMTVHGIFFAVGFAIVVGLNVVMSSQDPDPDPDATNRETAELANRKAEAKAIRAEQKAIEDAEKKRVKEVETQKRLLQQAENDRAARELAMVLIDEQLRVQRQNRVTELMILADTDLKKALKLASKEGIDLHAEAQSRAAGAAVVVGAALGAGVQAGAEFVRAVVKKTNE